MGEKGPAKYVRSLSKDGKNLKEQTTNNNPSMLNVERIVHKPFYLTVHISSASQRALTEIAVRKIMSTELDKAKIASGNIKVICRCSYSDTRSR